MPLIELDLKKSIEENASLYYDKAKKLKKKRAGALKALEESRKKLALLEKEQLQEAEKPKKIARKLEWYEKFRWFVTSTGFFVIGGRDATTNEIIIKKHTEDNDVVFHTDLSGSPFFVIKSKLNFQPYPPPPAAIDETTLREV